MLNLNPSLGPAVNGKQQVSVYDRELNGRRSVLTTPEEAENFVKERKETINSAAKKGFLQALLLTIGGVAAGALSMLASAKKGKANIGIGALLGGAIASCFGMIIPAVKAENADKKITQEFINNNK